jgi:dihydrofolate reductase
MTSLDGFFEGPNRDITWHTVDEEFNQFAIEQLDEVGALLFGRVTYELMASYWPTAAAQADDPEVASRMNALPKAVFTKTLQNASWNNTRLIWENVAEEVTRMKAEAVGDVAVFGSAVLLSTLMRLNLVNEHRLIVSPVLLGSGTPLFKNLGWQVDLKLVKMRTFRSGNVLLCYQPRTNGE